MKRLNYLIRNFLKFSQGSIISAVIDFAIFSLAFKLSGIILLAIIIGRLISASFNYLYNHKIAFQSESSIKGALSKYMLLVVTVMLCAYFGIVFMHRALNVGVYLSKVVVEFGLYVINFFVQRYLIFK